MTRPNLKLVTPEPEPQRSGPSDRFIGLTRNPAETGEGWPIRRTEKKPGEIVL